MLEEQAFDAKLHDRSGFQCGQFALDEYLRKYAVQQSAKGLCSIFVLIDDASPNEILSFYTLSAAQIDTDQLSDAEKKKLPRYPILCFRIGRLARSLEHRGDGMGTVLIGLAVDRCLKARVHVGAYALLVHAKSERASAFYQHYGFRVCSDSPMSLYLPLG